jgi:Tol biopolymer transport system component
MTPERYRRIGELFDEALERAPEERAAFLKEASGDDAELRIEVEKLLAHQGESAEFLSRPALDVAAALLAHHQSPSAVGQQLGHYQILALLGAGGMGEVYLAKDRRLQRQVALKVLPQTIAGDAERMRRFEQEALAASALNHPNILTIFEFGSEGETQFIASELVQGETLRTRLQRDCPPLSETLDLILQIASALQAAHETGIVHRDIKPENLMVRPDGIVKVLDFGLVKLTEAPASPVSTRPGTVLGTVRYMSPEQARGLEVDARTDIFSLGVVLYELVAGRAPFEGPSTNDVIAAILTQEAPPLSRSSPAVPAELERIIAKALEKDREKRYQAVSDLRLDLKRLRQRLEFEAELARSGPSSEQAATNEPAAEASARPRPAHPTAEELARPTTSLEDLVGATRRHKTAAVLTLASLFATAAVLMLWLSPFGRHRAPPPTARIIPFTTYSGVSDQPAFSPDGNQIAFSWDGGNGENLDLYVKLIGAGTPLRLTTNPAEEISPAWAPDGRHLAFIRRSASENGIFIIPALGGAERKLGQTEPNLSRQAWSQCRLSWSPDGKSLALMDRASPEDRYSIFLLSVEDGQKQKLTSPPESSDDNYPAFSPDGQTLAFTRSSGFSSEDLYLVSLRGGEPQRLTADGRRILSLGWTADGREIIFSSNRGGGFSLWRVAVSGGTPERVDVTGQNAYSPAISRQGNRLAYNVSFLDSNMWRLDRASAANQVADGRQNSPTKVISSTRQDHSPQFSPDGKKIVFVSDRSGSDEIWVCESDGSHPAQLTFFDDTVSGTPRWSPDSQQIVFDSRPASNSDIYVLSAAGGKPRALTQEPSHDVMPSWSRDGRWIYFCSNRSGAFQVWKAPAAGGPAIQVTKQGGFEAFESLDGKLLYYTKGRGPGGIWQMPVAGGEEGQVPELLQAGYWRYWAVLDDGIYFVAPVASARPAIMFFSFATRQVMKLGALSETRSRDRPD